jgi:short-subunit dehydrogenase
MQRYLEGVRNRMVQTKKNKIFVTDIIPGWVEVESEDIHQIPEAYWVATTQEAATQIVDAIKNKKEKAYITARWELIAFLYKLCPTWLYNKIGGF